MTGTENLGRRSIDWSAFGIVDSHLHFFNPDLFHYGWLDRRTEIKKPHLPPDYDRAIGSAQVEKIVLIEAAARIEESVNEARWMAEIPDSRIAAIVAQAPLERGRQVVTELEALKAISKVKGIRRVVRAPFQLDPDFCVRPQFVEGVRQLSQFSFTFDIACAWIDLPNVIQLVARVPEVNFILDHFGNPPISEPDFHVWQERLRELGRAPNVVCKISGLPVYLPLGWTSETLRPFFETAVDAFGFDRLLFGSDFPVQNKAGGFSRWIEMVGHLMSEAQPWQQLQFFQMNACRLYRIEAVDTLRS